MYVVDAPSEWGLEWQLECRTPAVHANSAVLCSTANYVFYLRCLFQQL